jgi:hypothetical protein
MAQPIFPTSLKLRGDIRSSELPLATADTNLLQAAGATNV